MRSAWWKVWPSETFAECVERLAIQGATDDPRPDKSDWIRLWSAAREEQGKPCTPLDWMREADT